MKNQNKIDTLALTISVIDVLYIIAVGIINTYFHSKLLSITIALTNFISLLVIILLVKREFDKKRSENSWLIVMLILNALLFLDVRNII